MQWGLLMLNPYELGQVAFRKINEIGQDGRNSKTFTAHDLQLNADIVIKQVSKSSLTSPQEYFSESRALYASAHPNVVQLHYACQDASNVFIAMPFYSNGSIKPLISNGAHLTVRRIVVLACQTLSGLHNIHSKGLIHFDVKPDNILLSDRGDAMLSDFGLAKQMLGGVAHPGKFYTSMVPPEVLAGHSKFDLTYDIYQIGLTLYRMCVGNEEFNRQFQTYTNQTDFIRDVRAGTFPDRKRFPPHVPARLRTVIKKCLKVDPAERYQSAIEVANALATVDGPEMDWQLTEVSGTRTWAKNEGGTEIKLQVNAAGHATCVKVSPSGTERRIKAMCRSVTDGEIRTFLGET
ncbi:serine/threonine-protein kinase [uncultured Sphingomonas sp.]|uniref:serine/threonine-protein kinase n=1 Tax=uncultured Sphingomonas sp. TaxID=158754 RepID=UPI0025E6F107|nr:serine/threonine-protein kinase [uncultured Sphingomonas sp.]